MAFLVLSPAPPRLCFAGAKLDDLFGLDSISIQELIAASPGKGVVMIKKAWAIWRGGIKDGGATIFMKRGAQGCAYGSNHGLKTARDESGGVALAAAHGRASRWRCR